MSREYVTTLESRIAHLETFLSRLKSAPKHERNEIIDGIEFGDHMSPVGGVTTASSPADETDMKATKNAAFQENRQGKPLLALILSSFLLCLTLLRLSCLSRSD